MKLRRKAILAEKDPTQWPFAILSLIQSLELCIKEVLRREHPLFIYENIDNPINTVSISRAFSRLENKEILNFKIPEEVKRKISKAIELRNKIIHFEYELNPVLALAKFSEIFSFVSHFQNRFFKIDLEELLGEEVYCSLTNIKKCWSELHKSAKTRLREESISYEFVWMCPPLQ